MVMDMSLLEIRGLETEFQTEQGVVKALRGIDYTVDKGEVLGIVGESGSGKSVGMLSLMGLLAPNGTVTAGEMIFDGEDISPVKYKTKKEKKEGRKAIDATAGMGEDAFLLAAQGYEVTLNEQNPVVAVLLKDALRRAKKHPILKEIAARMKLVEGDSVECMSKLLDPVDVIYLDPMFPARQKSSLINKKLQLIQKLEPPCSEETDLFDAAIKATPEKIIVKRPLKSEFLAGRKPSYTLNGKAIRYDCYTL